MRKNRKISKKMSVTAGHAARITAVVVTAFAVAILSLLSSSSFKHLNASIREKERLLAKLEDDEKRELANWERMKSSEKLESALLKHGLAMKYAKAEQVVRMAGNERPYPGQLSVALAAQRNRAQVVSNTRRTGVRPAAAARGGVRPSSVRRTRR